MSTIPPPNPYGSKESHGDKPGTEPLSYTPDPYTDSNDPVYPPRVEYPSYQGVSPPRYYAITVGNEPHASTYVTAMDARALNYSYVAVGTFFVGLFFSVFFLFVVAPVIFAPGIYCAWKSNAIEKNLVARLAFWGNIVGLVIAAILSLIVFATFVALSS